MQSLNNINKVFNNIDTIIVDQFNDMYEGFSFQYEGKLYHSRLAKKTPTKDGYFVTFWKKDNGKNKSYSISDNFDFLIINIIDDYKKGIFLFSKETLIDNNIIKTDIFKGKMGFRVYSIWDVTLNKLAGKTKAWQIKNFMEIK